MPVKPMEFTLDQNDVNETLSTGTAKTMTDIVVYKVPRHTVVVLRPEDTISLYLKDAGAECLGTDAVQILVRDPNGLSDEIIASGQYTVFKEFTDRNKLKRIGKQKIIKSDFQLVVQAKATTVLVVASCYHAITCLRYAETL
jgi:hypothetical protein